MDPLIIVFLVALLLGVIVGRGLTKFLIARGKRGQLTIWVDRDAMSAKISYEKRKGNEILVGKDADAKSYLLPQKGRFTSEEGSFWILDHKTGWALRPPSDEELFQWDPKQGEKETDEEFLARTKPARALLALSIVDPAMYRRGLAVNESKDALEANKNPDPWYAKLLPIAVVGLLVVGLLIYIAYKVH